MDVVLELDMTRYFPRRRQPLDPRPFNASAIASGGAGSDQRGSSTRMRSSRATLDGGRQLAADRLDLGKLGHSARF